MKLSSKHLEIVVKALQANQGQFFTVISEKRMEPGKLRVYNYKWQNRNALKGGSLPYDKEKKNLLIGYDPNAVDKRTGVRGGWRAVNCDDVAFIAVRTGIEEKDPFILINDLHNYRHCENFDTALTIVEKTQARQKKGELEILLEKALQEVKNKHHESEN